ncbi:hypothetical protein RB601_003675 [Gaeumannomyces tritici]
MDGQRWMPSSSWLAVPANVPSLLLGISVIAAVLLLSLARLLHSRSDSAHIPVLGSFKDPDFRKALEEAHLTHGAQAYALPTEPRVVVLSDCLLNRLKSAPESQLSAGLEVQRRGLGQYTDLGTPMPELFAAIKVDLTRHLRDLVPLLREEVEYACNLHLPERLSAAASDDGWHEVTAFDFVKRIVIVLNALALVGRRLSRDRAWQDASFGYSASLRAAFDALHRWPPWLRPLVHPFIFERIGLSSRRRAVADMLTPLLAGESDGQVRDSSPTLLGYLRQRLGAKQGSDPRRMARIQLRATLAGADTVSHVATNALLDLAARPECVAAIREELKQLAAPGCGEPVWTMAMVRRMSRLDSFIKESARLHPMFLLAMGRMTTSPLVLDDGTVVPKDATVYFDMHNSNNSPEMQPGGDPALFDGFRYSQAREEEGLSNKYLLATTGADHLLFGHGKESCPGRFFAAAEIKVLLAYLLLNFDLALPGPRPQHRWVGFAGVMDRGATVLMQRRKGEIGM